MKKIIHSNSFNGFISAQSDSTNSITFYGEIPENSKVNNICLIGEVEVNGTKLINPMLDEIPGVEVGYHLKSTEGAIATAYFVNGIPEQLRTDVLNYIISDFKVTCIEICPHCGH